MSDATGAGPPAGTRARTALAIWGDPIVGQALVLLLRGSGYDARFLPASSLDELGALEGVRVLLLAPALQLSTESREAIRASLRDVPGAAKKIPVLELIKPFEETREEGARDESWHGAPWPCSIEQLTQRIEAALVTNPGADPAAYRDHELE
jgi:hypothetical protein